MQLELYVLNLLDDDETAAIEQRIADEPAVRERVRELRGAASLLALDLEPIEPSPALKDRILAAARADLDSSSPEPGTPASMPAAEPAPPPVSIADVRRSRGMVQWIPWSVAAVLAIALIGSLLWNASLRSDLDERSTAIAHAVQTSGTASGASGEVVVLDSDGVALLTLSDLPALEPGKVYQVWLIADADSAPQPNVTFMPTNQGFANVAVAGSVGDYGILAVTIEPNGGSTAPTSDPLITSELDEPAGG
jgi:anti-sigma-K factor RskA